MSLVRTFDQVTPVELLLARALRHPPHAQTALQRLDLARTPRDWRDRIVLKALAACLPLCAAEATPFEWELAGYYGLWEIAIRLPQDVSLGAATSGTLCEVINGGFAADWRWPGKELALPKAKKEKRLTAVDLALQQLQEVA